MLNDQVVDDDLPPMLEEDPLTSPVNNEKTNQLSPQFFEHLKQQNQLLQESICQIKMTSVATTPIRTEYKGKTLMDASKSGDLPLLFLLISWGNSVNQTEPIRNATPLHWAAYHGHEDCVVCLLQHGANPNVQDSQEAQTPLMWACMGGHMGVVQTLVERFRVDAFSFLDAQQASVLTHCSQGGHTLVLHFLLNKLKQHRSEPLFDRDVANPLLLDCEKHTVLHWAAYNGHLATLKYWTKILFTEASKDPEIIWNWLTAVDVHKRTTIHWCARQGHLNVLRYLLSTLLLVPGKRTGAVVSVLNWKDSDGHTALLWAKKRNHVSLVNVIESFLRSDGLQPNSNDSEVITIEDDDEDDEHTTMIISDSSQSIRTNKNTVPPLLYVKPETNWEMIRSPKQLRRLLLAFFIYPVSCLLVSVLAPLIVLPSLIALIATAIFMSRRLLDITSGKTAQRDASLFGVYAGSIFLIIYIFFIYIRPVSATWIQVLMLLVSGTCSITTFVYIIQADPGYIYAPPLDSNFNELENPISYTRDEKEILEAAERGQIDAKSHCLTCMIKKPLRSKHDRVTDRCVSRFDHYCSWINMPVGNRNHVMFMAFVWSTLVVVGSINWAIIWYLINHLSDLSLLNALFVESPLPTYGLGYGFIVLVPLGLLTLGQTKNIFINMTGNESMFISKYPWLVQVPTSRASFMTKFEDNYIRSNVMNLFDRGYIGNFTEFFFGKGGVQWDRVYTWYPTAFARSWLSKRGVACPESVDFTTKPMTIVKQECDGNHGEHGHSH
jgi:ankyrin repeat protein